MDAVENQETQTEPWTIGRLLDWTARFLAQKGFESSRLDAEVLLARALNCRRIDLYTRFGETAAAAVRESFRALVRRRLEGCPVAYLVGRKEFFALELEVDSTVLIPRPETELVVVECLRLAKGKTAPRILDVGTGSGNIAVAVARQHGGAQVTAVDVSPEALAVARRNALRHGVGERISFLAGDLFEPIPADARFDFILSNPPYVASEEMDRLPRGVRDFEPRRALDGGPGGYAVLERLLTEAGKCLEPGGCLIVEIGSPQEGPARERFAPHPEYELAPTIFDYSRQPRVLRACYRPERGAQ